MNRRNFLSTLAAGAVGSLFGAAGEPDRPNIVVILADDMGYGDIPATGSRIPTPNLDRLAAEGVRLTDYYAAAAVCSPSRAGLLTGRYPARTGVTDVLFPFSTTGLPASETTIADLLRMQGYRSMCAGKWHLGWQTQFLPRQHGFDDFFGIPYSHDMSPLPLIHNNTTVEAETDLNTLTPRMLNEAVRFVRDSTEPFCPYYAPYNPHLPLITSVPFRGKSRLGPYGDMVMELDWCVGQILAVLDQRQKADNTLVIFTSDNGPWYQGSSGELRGRKGMTWDGGMREPFLARDPGRIPANSVSRRMVTALDLLPTLASLCGAPAPRNRLDGEDVWSALTQSRNSRDHDAFLFMEGLVPVRSQRAMEASRAARQRRYLDSGSSGWTAVTPLACSGVVRSGARSR